MLDETTQETTEAPSAEPTVNTWFAEWFYNTDLPTHLFNRFQLARADLIRRLDAAHKE
jgi:hypothetical protein